jgi:hypothetical protein
VLFAAVFVARADGDPAVVAVVVAEPGSGSTRAPNVLTIALIRQ